MPFHLHIFVWWKPIIALTHLKFKIFKHLYSFKCWNINYIQFEWQHTPNAIPKMWCWKWKQVKLNKLEIIIGKSSKTQVQYHLTFLSLHASGFSFSHLSLSVVVANFFGQCSNQATDVNQQHRDTCIRCNSVKWNIFHFPQFSSHCESTSLSHFYGMFKHPTNKGMIVKWRCE